MLWKGSEFWCCWNCWEDGVGAGIAVALLFSIANLTVAGIAENCGTTAANAFIVLNVLITLANVAACSQVSIIFYDGLKKCLKETGGDAIEECAGKIQERVEQWKGWLDNNIIIVTVDLCLFSWIKHINLRSLAVYNWAYKLYRPETGGRGGNNKHLGGVWVGNEAKVKGTGKYNMHVHEEVIYRLCKQHAHTWCYSMGRGGVHAPPHQWYIR